LVNVRVRLRFFVVLEAVAVEVDFCRRGLGGAGVGVVADVEVEDDGFHAFDDFVTAPPLLLAPVAVVVVFFLDFAPIAREGGGVRKNVGIESKSVSLPDFLAEWHSS
jgi:hypothetical protein